MSDWVERRAAIDAIFVKPAWHGSDGSYYHSDDIRDAIEQLPPAQPETAHWILTEHWDGTCATCSKCGFEIMVNEPGNGLKDVENLHFCSGCGRKMKKKGVSE